MMFSKSAVTAGCAPPMLCDMATVEECERPMEEGRSFRRAKECEVRHECCDFGSQEAVQEEGCDIGEDMDDYEIDGESHEGIDDEDIEGDVDDESLGLGLDFSSDSETDSDE